PGEDGDGLAYFLLRYARQLLKRASGDVCLERALKGSLERGLLDRQAIGVGRDHAQLLPGGRHEDAGEHWSGLIARGRSSHLGHGLHERCRRQSYARIWSWGGECRKVF